MFLKQQVTGTEPVSLALAKENLRIPDFAPEAEIGVMISAAREYCENYTGRCMIDQTVTTRLYADGKRITLPIAPVAYVESVKRIDSDGNSHAVAFKTDMEGVELSESVNGEVEVIYSATAEDVPFGMIQALLQLLNHYYDNRSAVIVGTSGQKIPVTVETLLRQYKRWWFK